MERIEGAKIKEERFSFLISLQILLQKKEDDSIQHPNLSELDGPLCLILSSAGKMPKRLLHPLPCLYSPSQANSPTIIS